MPEPVPPAWPPVTEMVTTLGLALAATAVIWFTESVSFTTMFCALSALSLDAGAWFAVTSAVMPAPEAPPMSAAATIAAATPRPTRRGFGAGCCAAGCPAAAVRRHAGDGCGGLGLAGAGAAEGGRHLAGQGLGRRGAVRPRRACCGRVVGLRGLAGLVDRARGRGVAGGAGRGGCGAAGAAARRGRASVPRLGGGGRGRLRDAAGRRWLAGARRRVAAPAVAATSPSRASPVGPSVVSVMVCSFQSHASIPPQAVCGIGEVCDPAIPGR